MRFSARVRKGGSLVSDVKTTMPATHGTGSGGGCGVGLTALREAR